MSEELTERERRHRLAEIKHRAEYVYSYPLYYRDTVEENVCEDTTYLLEEIERLQAIIDALEKAG